MIYLVDWNAFELVSTPRLGQVGAVEAESNMGGITIDPGVTPLVP
jgi:hypothetical protein